MPRCPSLLAWLLCTTAGWERARAASVSSGSASQSVEVPVETVKKEPSFTTERCGAIVANVSSSGDAREESIRPQCQAQLKSEKCGFFAQALALAIGHPNFDLKHFCSGIVSAHFCSETMDNLLLSQSVSDLAHGACRRSEGKEGDKTRYCDKFQFMLLHAVLSHELDTMRTCYMMEVEDWQANVTSREPVIARAAPLQAEGAGHQNATVTEHLRSFANVSANSSACNNATVACGGAAANASSVRGSIIVRPQPLSSNQSMPGVSEPARAQQRAINSSIIIAPVPATIVSSLGAASKRTTKPAEAADKLLVEPAAVAKRATKPAEAADRLLVEPAPAAQPAAPAAAQEVPPTAPQGEPEAAPDPSKSVLVVPFDRLPELAAALAAKSSEGSAAAAADMRSALGHAHASVTEVRSALRSPHKLAANPKAAAAAAPVAQKVAHATKPLATEQAAPGNLRSKEKRDRAPSAAAPAVAQLQNAVAQLQKEVSSNATVKVEAKTAAPTGTASEPGAASAAAGSAPPGAKDATPKEAAAAPSRSAAGPAANGTAAALSTAGHNVTAENTTALIAMNTVVTTGTVPATAAAPGTNFSRRVAAAAAAPAKPTASTAEGGVAAPGTAAARRATPTQNSTAVQAALANATRPAGNATQPKNTTGHSALAAKLPPIVRKEMHVAPLKWSFTPVAVPRAQRMSNGTGNGTGNGTLQLTHANSTLGAPAGRNATAAQPHTNGSSQASRSVQGNRTVAGLLAKDERLEKREEKMHYDGFLSKFVVG